MQQKSISGQTEEEVWRQVEADLKENSELLQYNVLLEQQGKQVALIIDIDPGGGFESGYATTQLLAPLANGNFELTVGKQGLLQEAGKLFGLQDITVGNPDIDKKFLIRSNDEEKTKSLFANEAISNLLVSLDNASLHTTSNEDADGNKSSYLELTVEDGITDPAVLRRMYSAFTLLRDIISAGY